MRRDCARYLWATSLLILAAAGGLGATPAHGQEAAKAKGRLPPYYSDIVTPAQRERIYAIQALFGRQREHLEMQLAALKERERMEVEAVLTPPQKALLARTQEAAAAKREKAAADKKAAAIAAALGEPPPGMAKKPPPRKGR